MASPVNRIGNTKLQQLGRLGKTNAWLLGVFVALAVIVGLYVVFFSHAATHPANPYSCPQINGAYPGLQLGSHDGDTHQPGDQCVSAIQWDFRYQSGQRGVTVNGVFDEATKQAVITYQRFFKNKVQDGVVTPTLMKGFVYIYGPFKPIGTGPKGLTLRVQNDKFVDQNGATVQLRGVNRAGTEFACANQNPPGFTVDVNNGSSIGGADPSYANTVATSLLTWDTAGTAAAGPHAINTVRIPLNEECWLGINGAPAAYSGANYQAFIKTLVDKLTSQNMYVVLDLHWAEPSTLFNQGQNVAPNADHSVTFWQQVASMFSNQQGYANVAFDLFNEPAIYCLQGGTCPSTTFGDYIKADDWAWKLYLNGGTYQYTAGDNQYATSARLNMTEASGGVKGQYAIAGTQQLVNTIRATGASNVVIVETLGGGSGYVDRMGPNMPVDKNADLTTSSNPQLAASVHSYAGFGTDIGAPLDASGKINLDYWFANAKDMNYNDIPNITGHYPVFIGEFGTYTKCPGYDGPWTTAAFGWLENHGYSYAAWGWAQNMGCNGPSLVTNNDAGTPTAFGADVKAHLQSRQGK